MALHRCLGSLKPFQGCPSWQPTSLGNVPQHAGPPPCSARLHNHNKADGGRSILPAYVCPHPPPQDSGGQGCRWHRYVLAGTSSLHDEVSRHCATPLASRQGIWGGGGFLASRCYRSSFVRGLNMASSVIIPMAPFWSGDDDDLSCCCFGCSDEVVVVVVVPVLVAVLFHRDDTREDLAISSSA